MYDKPVFDHPVHRLFFSSALLLLIGAGAVGCAPAAAEEGTSSSDRDEDADNQNNESATEATSNNENDAPGEGDDTEQFVEIVGEPDAETDPSYDTADSDTDIVTETSETDDVESDHAETEVPALDTDDVESETEASEPETDDSSTDAPGTDDSASETDDPEEMPSDDDPAGDPLGVKLTNGYAVIADFTGSVGVELNLGAEFSTPISTPVKCISQEELISFIEEHVDLFSAGELESIRNHRGYRERGYGAELLAGLLGLKLAGDVDHFVQKVDVGFSVESAEGGAEGKAFLNALEMLEEKAYTLTGTMTAVGQSLIPASPRFLVGITKLTFATGHGIRVIDTRIRVTDADGSQDFIREKPGDAPLRLKAEAPPENTVTLSHGYTAVAHSETGLETGEEAAIQIETAIDAVPHRDLVSFIERNAGLFSDEALDRIRSHASYTDDSRAPALLLGILGLKLGGAFEYFSKGSAFDISPFSEDDEHFIAALTELSDKTLTLSGEHIAVGNFGIATVPYVYVDRVRIALPNGAFIRAVDTNAEVADDAGDRRWVFSKADQPPLSLE